MFTAHVFLGQMISSENIYTTGTWGLSDAPLRALCYRALKYIEWVYDYIHYVCFSGANDFFGEYMHDWHMKPIRYASDMPRIHGLLPQVNEACHIHHWEPYVIYDCHMRPIRYACESSESTRYMWQPHDTHHREAYPEHHCHMSALSDTPLRAQQDRAS